MLLLKFRINNIKRTAKVNLNGLDTIYQSEKLPPTAAFKTQNFKNDQPTGGITADDRFSAAQTTAAA